MTRRALPPSLAAILARTEVAITDLLSDGDVPFADIPSTLNPDLSVAGLHDDDPEIDRRLQLQKVETMALARAVRPYLGAAIEQGVRDYLETRTPSVDVSVLAGIRRFCVEDVRPTYTAAELAEMWGMEATELFEFFNEYFEPVAPQKDHDDPIEKRQFSREDVATFLVSHVASPSVLAAALGDDLSSVFNSARTLTPFSGRLPRFVADALRASAEASWTHGATTADGITHLVTMHVCDDEPPVFRS